MFRLEFAQFLKRIGFGQGRHADHSLGAFGQTMVKSPILLAGM